MSFFEDPEAEREKRIAAFKHLVPDLVAVAERVEATGRSCEESVRVIERVARLRRQTTWEARRGLEDFLAADFQSTFPRHPNDVPVEPELARDIVDPLVNISVSATYIEDVLWSRCWQGADWDGLPPNPALYPSYHQHHFGFGPRP